MVILDTLFLLIKIILGIYCSYKFFIVKEIKIETLWYGILLLICIVV